MADKQDNTAQPADTALSSVGLQSTTVKRTWNQWIATPINQQTKVGYGYYQQVREKYPLAIIGSATGAVMLLSIPAGPFPAWRNGVLTFLVASLIVSPTRTIGSFQLVKDQFVSKSSSQFPPSNNNYSMTNMHSNTAEKK